MCVFMSRVKAGGYDVIKGDGALSKAGGLFTFLNGTP